MAVSQETKWGQRGWSRPRSQVSPWDGGCPPVWVLGFVQERIQERAIVKLLGSLCGDIPGGAVVKNLPANAGDTGLSPGPGRSHVPWSN